jgi:predicted DNA-binding transcriptional regulator YafY
MKLLTTFRSLLNEVASLGDLQDSIKKKIVMTIYYDGDEPGGKGYRRIEPVCLGYSKAGNLVLRAWDLDGASHTDTIGEQPLPGWRLFRADKILTYQPTTDNFSEVRDGFNQTGDKSMTNVITIADFSDNTDINYA